MPGFLRSREGFEELSTGPSGITQPKYRSNVFAGLERIPTYNKYLYHLRPWDSTPSVVYVDHVHRRDWWKLNPPTMTRVMLFLALAVLVQFVVSFLPLLANLQLLQIRWSNYVMPDWAYTRGWILLACWCITNALAALSVWFVYLDGGVEDHLMPLLLYVAVLTLEAIWADILFGGNYIAFAFFVWLAMLVLLLICAVVFFRIAVLAGLFLLPQCAIFTYGVAFLAGLWSKNGAVYVYVV
eukprot:RCo038621